MAAHSWAVNVEIITTVDAFHNRQVKYPCWEVICSNKFNEVWNVNAAVAKYYETLFTQQTN